MLLVFEPLYSSEMNVKDLPENCIITPHRGEFDAIFPKYNNLIKVIRNMSRSF